MTKARKLKLDKVMSQILIVASFAFLVTTALWAAKSGTFLDDIRTASRNNKAIIAVVASAVSLIVSGVAYFYSKKKNDLVVSILLIVAVLLMALAFILPLHDQKLYVERMNERTDLLAFFKSNPKEADMQAAMSKYVNDQTSVAYMDLQAILSDADFTQVVADAKAGTWNLGLMPVMSASKTINLAIEDGLVSAQADMHIASILMASIGTGFAGVSALWILFGKTVKTNVATSKK